MLMVPREVLPLEPKSLTDEARTGMLRVMRIFAAGPVWPSALDRQPASWYAASRGAEAVAPELEAPGMRLCSARILNASAGTGYHKTRPAMPRGQ